MFGLVSKKKYNKEIKNSKLKSDHHLSEVLDLEKELTRQRELVQDLQDGYEKQNKGLQDLIQLQETKIEELNEKLNSIDLFDIIIENEIHDSQVREINTEDFNILDSMEEQGIEQVLQNAKQYIKVTREKEFNINKRTYSLTINTKNHD